MKRCRICKSFRLKKVFSLGKQQLANKLLDKPKQKANDYPLDLYSCQHCTLLQLGKVVPKEEMYEEYFYIPSVSKTGLKHFKDLAKRLTRELKLKSGDLVVDIGGNDGSLLKQFRRMKVVNVDPAKNIKIDPQIPTVRDYFTKDVAEVIVRTKGKAKLVTGTNVFAHIDNLQEFLKNLDILLDDDGVFFAQFPDVRNLLSQNQFDTIYHEHLSYFTYEPLHHLFTNTPFELWQITSDNMHGGSMQIWVRRRPKLLEEFRKNVEEIKEELLEVLLGKNIFHSVVGFGAAAKGTVLLNYCDLDSTVIDYIVDNTPYKQGKFVPGVNIPIYPESKLLEEKPGTIVLILAWNFKEEIMEKLKNRGYTFIVPIPKVQIFT